MTTSFQTINLLPELVQAVTELGYEQPTAIQTEAIPALLEGRDVLGQAQTGTGKTAAFGLPMLQSLDMQAHGVQALVLTPTRELAMQVANTIYRYGQHRHVHVLPVYGGQPYSRQTRRLERGAHIVVGTPGRLLDLIRQGALNLSTVRFLVIDEADELLNMGFIDDVEAILSQTPPTRQTALFSATLPAAVRHLADKYMHNPLPITIAAKTMTVAETEQRYYLVDEGSKVAALTRLLEVENISSALIFTNTKVGTAELAETLASRGYPTEAIHGDLSQAVRETVLNRFRKGSVTILVATNVVARGLDIQDVSHVVNFDMPYDGEEYVHRIGRTGRAGRSGIALTLVSPRDRRRLRDIETYTRQKIERASLPNQDEILTRRNERFKTSIDTLLNQDDLSRELTLVTELSSAGYDMAEVAAAAIRLARADEAQRPIDDVREVVEYAERPSRWQQQPARREPFHAGDRSSRYSAERRSSEAEREQGMVRLSLDLGRVHGIRPGDVVGAIASEAGIPSRGIGAIDIRQNQTFVDVKAIHADRVLRQMRGSRLRGQAVRFARAE